MKGKKTMISCFLWRATLGKRPLYKHCLLPFSLDQYTVCWFTSKQTFGKLRHFFFKGQPEKTLVSISLERRKQITFQCFSTIVPMSCPDANSIVKQEDTRKRIKLRSYNNLSFSFTLWLHEFANLLCAIVQQYHYRSFSRVNISSQWPTIRWEIVTSTICQSSHDYNHRIYCLAEMQP